MPAHVRVAAVPTSQLLAVLRDRSEPRAERLRVAEVLRAATPEAVEELARETADEDLAAALAKRESA